MMPVLAGSLIASAIYAAFFCNRSGGVVRVLIKTAATALLTLWAWQAGGPILLAVALAFSTLGDALLGADEKRFLLGGMAAFFAAHVAYIALFWDIGTGDRTALILIAQLLVTFGAAGFIRQLLPYIDKPMRLPVITYTIVIVVMANAALRLPPAYILATLGALAFTASDIILSLELFRLQAGTKLRMVTARLVWGLYYGGQALIAYAVISAVT